MVSSSWPGQIRARWPTAPLRARGLERSRCLVKILQTLREVVAKHHPTVCAIEGLFYAQNLQTALIMGEARGAALAALAEGDWTFLKSRRARSNRRWWVMRGPEIGSEQNVQRLLQLPEPPSPTPPMPCPGPGLCAGQQENVRRGSEANLGCRT